MARVSAEISKGSCSSPPGNPEWLNKHAASGTTGNFDKMKFHFLEISSITWCDSPSDFANLRPKSQKNFARALGEVHGAFMDVFSHLLFCHKQSSEMHIAVKEEPDRYSHIKVQKKIKDIPLDFYLSSLKVDQPTNT